MKQRAPIRWSVEAAVVKAFLAVVGWLPSGAVLFLGRRIGDLLYLLMRGRNRVGRDNLARALGLSPGDPEVPRILRGSFRHFALVPLELILLERELRRATPEVILELFGESRRIVDELVGAGKGAVFVTAHFGNWEVLGALAPRVGVPLCSVGRKVDNPGLQRLIDDLRTRQGQKVVDKDGAPLRLARELRSGTFVGMLLDQHAGRRGIRVPFFGRPCSTFPTAALLARRFDVPLLPVLNWRTDRRMRFQVRFFPPLHPDPSLSPEEDIYRMTMGYLRCLEEAVRSHPDQWLWFHRRWREGGKEPQPEWQERYAGAS